MLVQMALFYGTLIKVADFARISQGGPKVKKRS
jgi:hypothetical protein